jgi:precorrin-4/cobalt-precorrin-4 C11-methyltransferase
MNRHPILFVGGGPGDPELITVKGRKAMENADLVLYAGSLVSEAILGWCRQGAERVDTAPLHLEEICRLMISAHQGGKRVVRLHTGDLSLYSAVHEQANLLRQASIPFTLIPGVTAASAAAAALGMELTVPEKTQTVILTRTSGRTFVPERESISSLSRHGATMAIYLSAHKIAQVVDDLSGIYGRDAPVVVAYRVTWPDEKMIRGTLASIEAQLSEEGINRHALILVGPPLSPPEPGTESCSRLYDETFSHGYRTGKTD